MGCDSSMSPSRGVPSATRRLETSAAHAHRKHVCRRPSSTSRQDRRRFHRQGRQRQVHDGLAPARQQVRIRVDARGADYDFEGGPNDHARAWSSRDRRLASDGRSELAMKENHTKVFYCVHYRGVGASAAGVAFERQRRREPRPRGLGGGVTADRSRATRSRSRAGRSGSRAWRKCTD